MTAPASSIFWLFALLLLLIFFVGCQSLRSGTPTQPGMTFPPVTLTVVRTPAIVGTPIPVGTVSNTLTPARTPEYLTPPSPPPKPELSVEQPACFDSVSGIQCYGIVRNPLSVPLRDISLVATSPDSPDTSPRYFSLEQRIIESGSFAPYRVPHIGISAALTPFVEVASVKFAQHVSSDLIVAQDRSIYDARHGIYIVTATITNVGPVPVDNLQAIVTLFDTDHVVAFRTLRYDARVSPGNSTTLRTIIIPEVVSNNLRHSITVESLTPPADTS